jgi:folate-dependent phosphoribosylglycinamide formyltransferase PurN
LTRYAWGRNRNQRDGWSSDDHLAAAVSWLARAQDATPDGGVAGRYHLGRGWSSSYPETTGYVVTTFLALARLPAHAAFQERASRAVAFLLGLQLDDGAFPGGEIAENVTEPSVFNTAQILSGLQAWHAATGDVRALDAAMRAARWLAGQQDDDGAWRRHVYRGFATTYTAHASCWLADFGHHVADAALLSAARRHLQWVLSHVDEGTGWFDLAGFDAAQHHRREAFTHTIAYTLWGVLHSGHLLDSREAVEAVTRAAWAVARRMELLGRLPGVLDAQWRARSDFSCVTGTAQMVLIWCRLAELTGDLRFLNAAHKGLDAVKASQMMRPAHADLHGAIPGSDPVWGDYVPLAFPNWAAKYAVDALLRLPATHRMVLEAQRSPWIPPADLPTALPALPATSPGRRPRIVLYASPGSPKVGQMLSRWTGWGFRPSVVVIERGVPPSPWRRLAARLVEEGWRGLWDGARRRIRRSGSGPETGDVGAGLDAAAAARRTGIPVVEVDSLTSEVGIRVVRALDVDLAIHAGAGLLRTGILAVPKLGTLNAHMGVLPRYRGVNVAEWTSLEGGPFGCTVHLVDEGIDTGPILVAQVVPITAASIAELRTRIDAAQIALLGSVVQWVHDVGTLPRTRPQLAAEGVQFFRMHDALKAALENRLGHLAANTPVAERQQSAGETAT